MNVPAYKDILVGGEWLPAAGGTYPIINPATEEIAGYAPDCSVEQALAAARAARVAFESGPWPRLSGAERGALLRQAGEEFQKRAPQLVDLVIAETGAVRRVAEPQQVGAVGARLLKYAALAAEPLDEELPDVSITNAAGTLTAGGIAAREPVGVVACINPFNFPMTNCAGKIGPALACGNTVVIKPAPADPMAVVELSRIVDSVLPAGVVNFVCSAGPETGVALVESPDVDMISFTGSTVVGQAIQAEAARRMKRTLLELGGKSPQIVFADADRAKALRSAMQVWTFHSGQICIAGTRLFIEDSIYDEFVRQLVEGAAAIKIGDPRESDTVMGPLISAAQRERVERSVAAGLEQGAVLACGGKRPASPAKGYYFEPTLLAEARNDMRVAREEIFGPVITAIRFKDEADAVAQANDSDYGLYGYVWSGDAARALRVARAVRTGSVQVNGSPAHPDAPFGGYKMSGIGRDGGRYALQAYTELKYIGWTA